jgi:hypothetical protein
MRFFQGQIYELLHQSMLSAETRVRIGGKLHQGVVGLIGPRLGPRALWRFRSPERGPSNLRETNGRQESCLSRRADASSVCACEGG